MSNRIPNLVRDLTAKLTEQQELGMKMKRLAEQADQVNRNIEGIQNELTNLLDNPVHVFQVSQCEVLVAIQEGCEYEFHLELLEKCRSGDFVREEERELYPFE